MLVTFLLIGDLLVWDDFDAINDFRSCLLFLLFNCFLFVSTFSFYCVHFFTYVFDDFSVLTVILSGICFCSWFFRVCLLCRCFSVYFVDGFSTIAYASDFFVLEYFLCLAVVIFMDSILLLCFGDHNFLKLVIFRLLMLSLFFLCCLIFSCFIISMYFGENF